MADTITPGNLVEFEGDVWRVTNVFADGRLSLEPMEGKLPLTALVYRSDVKTLQVRQNDPHDPWGGF